MKNPNFKLPDQVTHSSEILYTLIFCAFSPSLKYILNKEKNYDSKIPKVVEVQKSWGDPLGANYASIKKKKTSGKKKAETMQTINDFSILILLFFFTLTKDSSAL